MRTRITFTGDLLAYHSLISKSKKGKVYDFSSVFGRARSLFNDSDYVVGNLETPLAGESVGYTRMDMLFNTPDEFARDAKSAGFNMFSTANNHCMDKGEEGILRTLVVLDNYGIDHTGTFCSKDERRYFIKDINGIRFSFVSCTYGTNPNVNGFELNDENAYMVNLTRQSDKPYKRSFAKQAIINLIYRLPRWLQEIVHPLYPKHGYLDCVSPEEVNNKQNEIYLQRLSEIIQYAKTESDIVIVCLHSGGQFNSSVGAYTNHLIDAIEKMSVDALIVNHPHCVLGSKWEHKNRFVAFSLGNFCFTPQEGYFVEGVYGEYGVVLNLDFDSDRKRLYDVSFSVVKNVKSQDGRVIVWPVSDLFDELTAEGKQALTEDVNRVISRFLGRDFYNIEVASIYRYSQFCNN